MKTNVVDCFNLIFPLTAQQQHMALSEILLLHSSASGLTETGEGRAPCKEHTVSVYWIGEEKANFGPISLPVLLSASRA